MGYPAGRRDFRKNASKTKTLYISTVEVRADLQRAPSSGPCVGENSRNSTHYSDDRAVIQIPRQPSLSRALGGPVAGRLYFQFPLRRRLVSELNHAERLLPVSTFVFFFLSPCRKKFSNWYGGKYSLTER